MSNFILIENRLQVDVVTSAEMVDLRSKSGWQVIRSLTAENWVQAVAEAYTYAQEHNKRCHLPKPISEEERREILARMVDAILSWTDAGT